MEIKKPRLRYFMYPRKSSESEDRQVQSIDDQINWLKDLAQRENVIIKEILPEAKSAKRPNSRPVFEDMLRRIEAGEADGILCWQSRPFRAAKTTKASHVWELGQRLHGNSDCYPLQLCTETS